MDQGTRKALILKLIDQGVFTGVQALDSPPRVGVTAIFQGLNPDLKQQFIATVYSYINNGAPGTQTLQLIDVTTGKLAGTFTGTEGLKLL